MQNRQDRAVQYSLSIVIAMLCMATIHAQQQPTPPPIIGWGFDEFHIGGEMLAYPSIGKDSFNMDFIYQYGGYPTLQDMRNPGNDSTDRRNFRTMLVEAFLHGMKVVYAPKNIFNLWPGRMANSLETYFDFRADTLSMTDFRQKADTGLISRLSLLPLQSA